MYLGRGLASWEAAELLRGPQGTEVALTLGTGRRVRLVRDCAEATADSGYNVAVTGARWAGAGVDSNNVAEVAYNM